MGKTDSLLGKTHAEDRFILGFCGAARSGKDTAGDIAINEFGFTRMGLADQMKHYLSIIFGWDWEHLYGDLKDVVDPEWGFSPRKALQLFGTDFGRALDEDLWLKLVDKATPSGNWVITDVRFENEAEFVRRNGILVHVYRSGGPKVEAHKSEEPLPAKPEDYIYDNSGSLEDYQETIREFMRTLMVTLTM